MCCNHTEALICAISDLIYVCACKLGQRKLGEARYRYWTLRIFYHCDANGEEFTTSAGAGHDS